MARLTGRHWGLAGIVAASPLFLAFMLGASEPALLGSVLRTPVGGLSWALAVLLGIAGGALFARILSALQHPSVQASPVRRVLGTVGGALAPVALCIVPAVSLLLAGPTWATVLERSRVPAPPEVRSLSATATDLLGQVRRRLPRTLPLPPSRPLPW